MQYIGESDFRHDDAQKLGILFVNLGTPDAPDTAAIRRFLSEFLWDPRVIEIPRLLWWLILHLIILRVRPKKVAKMYQKIWTSKGSPLLVNSKSQLELVTKNLSSSISFKFKPIMLLSPSKKQNFDILFINLSINSSLSFNSKQTKARRPLPILEYSEPSMVTEADVTR